MSAGTLRGFLARVVRAQEAFEDGDPEFAFSVLADLRHDLWRIIESLEREERDR